MTTELRATALGSSTKGQLRRMRSAGLVPISLQHRGEETLHLQTDARALDDLIHRHGAAAMLELVTEPDAKRLPAMVHDVQRDPISRQLLHVALQAVVRGEPMKAHVPVLLHGTPESVANGEAVLQQAAHAIEVRALPKDLPEHLTVDASRLQPGDTLTVADLPHPDKYQILSDASMVLASVVRSKAAVAEEAAAEAAEPDKAEPPTAVQAEAA